MSDGYNISIGVDSRSGEQGVKSFTAELNKSLRALREFDAKASNAFKALDDFSKLSTSGLTRSLRNVATGVEALNKVKINTRMMSSLQTLQRTIAGLRFTGAESLKRLPDALKELDKIKINTALVKQLGDLKNAIKGFANPPKDLAKWPQAISKFSGVSVSPALAKNLEALKASLKGFNGPPKAFGNWSRTLSPLSTIKISPALANSLSALKLAMRGLSGPSKSLLALPKFLAELSRQKVSATLATNLASLKAVMSGFSGPSAASAKNIQALLNAMKGADVSKVAAVAAQLQKLNGLSINVGRSLGNASNAGNRGFSTLRGTLGSLKGAMNDLAQQSANMHHAMMAFQTLVGGFTITSFIKGVSETTNSYDSLIRTLGAVSSSQDEVASHLQFIDSLTTKMPISLEAAAESYKKFAVAARLSGMSVDKTQGIFENFSIGFSAMGLSVDSTKYAFIALEQMISKGNISMEELKTQLGDHLPGAVQILADSLDMPVDKLFKMIEAGEVTGEALVKMGERVKENFAAAAEAAKNSTQGQLTELQNSWTRFEKVVGNNGLNSGLGALYNTLSKILNSDEAKKFAVDIGQAFQRLFRSLSALANMLWENRDTVISFFKAFAGYMVFVGVTGAITTLLRPLGLIAPLMNIAGLAFKGLGIAALALVNGKALSGLGTLLGLIGKRVLIAATIVGILGVSLYKLTGYLDEVAGTNMQKSLSGIGTDIYGAVEGAIKKLDGLGDGLFGSIDSQVKDYSKGWDEIYSKIADSEKINQETLDRNAEREEKRKADQLKALTAKQQKLWDEINPIGKANEEYQKQLKLIDEIAKKKGLTPEQTAGAKSALAAKTLEDRNPIEAGLKDYRDQLAQLKAQTAEQRAAAEATKWKNDLMEKGVVMTTDQWNKATDAVKRYQMAIEKMQGSAGNGIERWAAQVGDFTENYSEAFKDSISSMSDELANFITGADADFAGLARSILRNFAKIALDSLLKDMFGAMGLDGQKNGEKEANKAIADLSGIGKTITTTMTNVYTSGLTIDGKSADDVLSPSIAKMANDTPLRGTINPAGLRNGFDASRWTPFMEETAKRSRAEVATDYKYTEDAKDYKLQLQIEEAKSAGLQIPASMQDSAAAGRASRPQGMISPNVDTMPTGALNSLDSIATDKLYQPTLNTMPILKEKLMKDLNLKDFQAAGIVGNFAHETNGFRANNEIGSPDKGFGLAQWTGSRREEFEAWAKENQRDPKLFGTQYDYFKKEATTTEKAALDKLRQTTDLSEATQSFQDNFERPGVKHFTRRMDYAQQAMDSQLPVNQQKTGMGLMDVSPTFKQNALGTGKGLPNIQVPSDVTNGGADIQMLDGLKQSGRYMDSVKGLTFHHTGGRGSPESVVNTLNQRNLGAQYIMDRDGKIFQTVPDGMVASHMKPAQNGSGLSNQNALGIEMIAKNNEDLTDAQRLSGLRFIEDMKKKYPGIGDNVYGHGELNNHKQATEGMGVVDLYRQQQQLKAQQPVTLPANVDTMPTGSINAPTEQLTQLNQTLQATGTAAQQIQAPMDQMKTAVQDTSTGAMTAAQQAQSANQQMLTASQQKTMASQQEAAAAQSASTGMMSASMNAQTAGPAFQQAGVQIGQAGQSAQAAGAAAQTANPGLNSFGGGISQLLGPLASAVPGLGQFGGAIVSLLGQLGGGGGMAGLFSEGGYSTSPVETMRIPHFAEGTANTSGGMPAVLHPNEAVIPLSRGRKVPVEINGESMASRKAGQETLDKDSRPVMVINLNGVTDADSFKRSKGQVTSAMLSAQQRSQMRDG